MVSRKEIMVSRMRGKGFGVYGLSKNCYELGDSTMKREVCPGRVFWEVSGTVGSEVWGTVDSDGFGIGEEFED
ncbi:hypothetical protein DEO72_LG8g886 [Vigna unguiculata]|uniref:Uncharacterized protein n=1 Tax=Vigna unguiculata TaxID=3917 RepID=A0A4D6MQC5_VIGUN|nr:hypothetical protein DEO72_LG8g886 [Vigna unguiculata]